MAQLLNSELVFYGKIGAEVLPLLNVASIPEPDVDEQTSSQPLKHGSYSAGGRLTYGSIEASVVYDPATMEAQKARLQKLQGGIGKGTGAFHEAPGLVPKQTPIAGETYPINLLRCWLSDGVNSDGDAITMLSFEFGVEGVGS